MSHHGEVDEIEISCPDIKGIVNTVFIELTRRMASIEMRPRERFKPLSSGACFEIRTEGAFFSLILFEIEEKLYEKIAVMLHKSGNPSAQEKEQSVTEYLNVICGRILSEINNGLGRRSKLSIPLSIECREEEGCFRSRLEVSYACPEGNLNIIICFDYE